VSGFASYTERIDAEKIRQRNPKFHDHFSQATLFYNSQSEVEKGHIIRALRFELGKVETPPIRERMLGLLTQVDRGLAESVAQGLGIPVPRKLDKPLNMSVPADVDPKKVQPKRVEQSVDESPALRQIGNPNFPEDTIKTRKIAILLADGFDDEAVGEMNKALLTAGAAPKIIAPRLGVVTGANGTDLKVDFSFLTAASVLFDAVYIPGGEASVTALTGEQDALEFVQEAFKHCKTIAASGDGTDFLNKALAGKETGNDPGLIADRDQAINKTADQFIKAIAKHKHWEREQITMPL
jgi:catalase